MRRVRADGVVRVLTGLVSIAYFGTLVLAVVVLIGLPAVRVAAGGNPEWEIGLPITVAATAPDATVVTRWGDARLEMEEARGSLRVPIGMLPWWLFAVFWTYLATVGALALTFLHQLRHIFQQVRSGSPFAAANAPRLRRLGLVALAFAILTGVSEVVTSLAVTGGRVGAPLEVRPGLPVDGSMVLLGLVLLALAEIFRRGAELEYEQSLTV